jgi:hypothetical protein
MHMALLIRAGWLSVCLFAFATVALAQDASPTPLRIAYTGKLLGYFRVPSEQTRSSTGCPDGAAGRSKEADTFLNERYKNRDAILVGTGDNFSPQLESRVFTAEAVPPDAKEYIPDNKELYSWDHLAKDKKWVLFGKESDDLKRILAEGKGIIPTDNVGCFLAAARFSAVVPGKHDFYFGTERVRQLARFMAGINKDDNYQPVQMLGANLVVKSARLDDNQAPAATEKWPKNVSAQNLKSVYPWFSAPISLKVTAPKGERFLKKLEAWQAGSPVGTAGLQAVLQAEANNLSNDADDRKKWKELLDSVKALEAPDSVRICSAGEFNEVSIKACTAPLGYPLLKIEPATVSSSVSDFSITYSFSVKETDRAARGGKAGHYATFEPGKNYGLCLRDQPQPGAENDEKSDVEKQCTVFPVHRPFFSYPHKVPTSGDTYTGSDPDPFVFIPNAREEQEVAIFGVVEPHLGEQVGVLNFSWRHEDEKLKSLVGVEEPVEAIKQQLAYFKQWYMEQNKARGREKFTGLKILLAQMSPQRARMLATQLPEFQVIVAGADQDQASDKIEQSLVWTSKSPAGTFIAIPSPSYDTKNKKVVVNLGLIQASTDKTIWQFSSKRPADADEASAKEKADKSKEVRAEDELARLLRQQLAGCLNAVPRDSLNPTSKEKKALVYERLQLLTLCAMRQRTGADVAMLQVRDFFNEQLPDDANEPRAFQRILDSIIWKGDLLTLLYVPGSALKKALEQSGKYEQEDTDPLSLADQSSRGLVVLGAEKQGKEYLVNEVPLDEKKIYAVATTDYIGAGDTGYPDLDAAALNRKNIPTQFPSRLESISSVVCRKLLSDDDKYKANCLDKLKRDDYLDKITAQAAPRQRPPGFAKRLWDMKPFKWPDGTKESETLGEAVAQNAQRRPIWVFSLQNFSVGFNGLSNNLTDKEVTEKFAGVPTSGVNTTKFHEVTVGLGARFSRATHRGEFYLATGIDFKEKSTGDVDPVVNQINNRVTADAGYILNLRGGRSKDRVGINFSLHSEMPFQQPFTNFDLGTGDTLKIAQDRGLLLLPRVGLRWQNSANSFEVGAQAGREVDALNGYRFETQGTVVECLPNPAETFADCIKRLSTLPETSITKDSVHSAILANRPRVGLYWKFNISIPFGTKVKYELKQEADFFFKFNGDNATDTRYRDVANNSLKFFVWPNFSIGPTLQLLFYRNKVNGDFLFQKKFGLETTISFDIFNRREKRVQLTRKPAGQ